MNCVYKEYEIKTKMVEEEWLQLKIKFLLGYNMKIFTERGRGNEPLLGESTDGVRGRSTRYWTS